MEKSHSKGNLLLPEALLFILRQQIHLPKTTQAASCKKMDHLT
jgi:hypothetical protein